MLNVLFGIVVIRVLLSSVVVSLEDAPMMALPLLSGPFSRLAILGNVQNVLAGAG